MIKPIVIDFETDPFEEGLRAPKPVGVSILDPRAHDATGRAYYYH